MRHTWKESPVAGMIFVVGILLGVLGAIGYMHGRSQRQYQFSAVTHQIDSHSARIADVLLELHDGNRSEIKDAVYGELVRPPSTSLITRDMVSVRQSTGAVWICVIDLTSLGLQQRQIQEASKQ